MPLEENRLSTLSVPAIIAYSDKLNEERGRQAIKWVQINPDGEPNLLTGVHPQTGAIIGPGICRGQRYRLRYTKPHSLPFNDESGQPILYQVKEIEGTLGPKGLWLLNINGLVCDLNDETVTTELKSSKSVFRLCPGDEIKEVI